MDQDTKEYMTNGKKDMIEINEKIWLTEKRKNRHRSTNIEKNMTDRKERKKEIQQERQKETKEKIMKDQNKKEYMTD